MPRVALDSNILLYFEGIDDTERQDRAVDIVRRLPQEEIVIPAQAIGELFNVLVRRGGLTRIEAERRCQMWIEAYEVIGTTSDTIQGAIAFAAAKAFSIWDAVILQAAVASGCRLLLSEDMQHGFTWNGVTIINPFLAEMHPFLTELLGR